MRPIPLRLRAALLVVLLLLLPAARTAGAQGLRVLSTDERGVTLRLDLPAWRAATPRPDGRVELEVPGYSVTALPGRPLLPFAQALVALPPGAGAVARLVEGGVEESRTDLRPAIGARPVTRDGAGGRNGVPALEPVPPIADGPWPREAIAVGEPVTVRRQRMVAVQVSPFRWDEAAGTLSVRRSMTVRVDFTGPVAAPSAPESDSHWEPVFRNALANYEQGRRWRVPRAAAPAPGRLAPSRVVAGAGFDESEPEVRVRVDSTGVYAFPYEQLAAHGYPAGVPVAEVSLHRHEYVGPVDPPYVTVELPVELDDANGNGLFDAGDAVVAFVQDWAERGGITSVMQRDWGDAEMVYATRVRTGGLRMATRPGWRDDPAPARPASYPWTQRWERTTTHFAYPSPIDTATVDRFLWTSFFLYYARPESLTFEVHDLDTSRAVAFRTRILGKDYNAHVMFGRIRNGAGRVTTVVDSVTWYGKEARTIAATVPGGALGEGPNRLALWGKGLVAPPDPVTNNIANAGLDWYEATYWRGYRALAGYLDATSADATGGFELRTSGFTSPVPFLRVYDVTVPAAAVRLAVGTEHMTGGFGEFGIDFQDSTGATPRRYVVFDTPKTVPASAYGAVTRRQLSSNAGERDYVIVAPEAFVPALAPLVALRESQGLGVVVAPLEAVNDEFNGGRTSRWAIKRFLRYALERWNTRFVLLVGDGSADGRHLLPSSGRDWVPVALVPGPVSSGTYGLEMIPADPWYGWCVDENPACLSSTRMEPDLYVGRLPVNSLAEAEATVAKVVAYEDFGADETWRRRMVLLADDAYSGATTFGGPSTGNDYCYKSYEIVFRQLNHAVASTIALPLATPTVMDLRSYLTDPTLYQANGPGDTCRVGPSGGAQRAEGILRANFDPVLFQRLNDGVLWWNYQGHANAGVLSHEGFYRNLGTTQDRENFMNDGRLFLFTAFSCHANAFADVGEADAAMGPSLGENMVTLPQRGAIASWASSGFEIVPNSGTYHLNVELARTLFADPPRDDEMGRSVTDRGARVPLGEVIALTLLRYLPTVQASSVERGVGLTYNLLGDPASRMWVGPAQITVTANGQPVTDGEPVRLATADDSLRLEAEFASNVAIDSIVVLHSGSDGTSVVADSLYTLSPAFPDTAPGGFGGRRYHLSYRTALASGAERFTLRLHDRYGVSASFDVVFEFQTQLFAGGAPLRDGDLVAADAALTLVVLSPFTLPAEACTLLVDGVPQPFSASPARGDTSSRQWLLAWTHAPYAPGTHVVRLSAPGAVAHEHRFRVEPRFALSDAMAFPNPFDDELGTRFLFTLTGDGRSDVLVRVFTVSGRRVYEHRETGLDPGHHEIAWDGRDAEGDKLANGVYFFTLVAHGPSGTSSYDGRLVKLRKPRRSAEPTAAE